MGSPFPSEAVAQSREILETALDQIVIESIPAYDINVDEECVDSPADVEKPGP